MDLLISISFAFLGGIIPALIWLAFWLHEDRKNPEPNRLILLTFFFGMLAVPVAFFLQFIFGNLLIGQQELRFAFESNYVAAIITMIIWAASEEIVKYAAAFLGGISKKANDEPIDPMIYMITAALGFAALENTLFLFEPLLLGDTTTALITGNMRFVGATLLHVTSSAIVGLFISLSYYKSALIKKHYLITGLILSIGLHTIFNSFIIRAGKFTVIGFAVVWLVSILLIYLFERIKRIKNL